MKWPMTPISEFVTLLRNGKSIKQDPASGGLPITRIETIADGTIDSSRLGYAGLEIADCKGWLLQEGDILVSHINSAKHLGKCAIFKGSPPDLVHGMNLLVLRADQNCACPRYIFHALRSQSFRRGLPRITKHSVNQSSFNISSFKRLKIPLPPLPEQKRIAAILDAADELRVKRRKSIEELDTLLQATFLDMFGDPRVPGRPGKYETRTVPMGNLVRIRTGKLDANAADENGRYPFFTCASETLRINTEAYDTTAVLVAGNGDLNVKFYSGKFNAYQRTYIIESADQEHLHPLYLYVFLDLYVSELRKKAIGGVIKYIKKPYLTDAELPLPSLDLQLRFATIVEKHNELTLSLRNHECSLNSLFESLQTRAFKREL